MATIQSSIKLNDGMTPALRSINKALNLVLNTFQAVQGASMRPIDVAAVQAARNELARAAVSIDQMGNESVQAANATQRLTQNMVKSAQAAQQVAAPVDRVEKEINQANSAELRLLSSMNKTLQALYKQQTNQIRVTASIKKVLPAITQNTQAQERFNQSLNRGSSSASKLLGNIKAYVGAYMGMQAGNGLIGTADSLTQTTARLALMNKGQETTAELEEKIYQSALRSRAGYLDTASAVSKLGLQTGNLFKSNDQIIQFTENFNKMAVVSGASSQQSSAALLQITQALASGVLRGDELKSVLENMPVVAQYIAKELKVPVEQVRELGYDGKISAKQLASAMLNATDDINKKFKSMPYTWQQVWTLIKTYSLKVFRPIFTAISKITSSQRFIRFANEVGNILRRISGQVQNMWSVIKPILGWIYDRVAGIYNFIKNNWGWIRPIVLGIAAAFIVLKAPLIALWVWTTLVTIATKAWAAAQAIYNAIAAANPITLVILGIILFVALIYAAVAAINKWCGTNYSATGLICGFFSMMGAHVYNQFVTMWNTIAAFINFFGNVFSNPIYSIKKLFVDMAVNILKLIKSITEGWDECATNLVNAMLSAVNGVLKGWNWLADKLGSFGEKMGIGKATLIESRSSITSDISKTIAALKSTVAQKPDGYKTFVETKQHKNYADAAKSGYNWGAEKATQAENFINGKKYKELPMEEYKKLVEKYGKDNVDKYGNIKNGDENDIGKALSGKLPDIKNQVPDLSGIANDVGNISENSDKLAASEEELNFMRDYAERKAINRYTLTDMNLNVTNNNSINSKFDMDDVVSYICNKMSDEVEATALGGNHI